MKFKSANSRALQRPSRNGVSCPFSFLIKEVIFFCKRLRIRIFSKMGVMAKKRWEKGEICLQLIKGLAKLEVLYRYGVGLYGVIPPWVAHVDGSVNALRANMGPFSPMPAAATIHNRSLSEANCPLAGCCDVCCLVPSAPPSSVRATVPLQPRFTLF